MLVAYTYRSDDTSLQSSVLGGGGGGGGGNKASGQSNAPEMKTFSFGIVVLLGSIVPREEVAAAAAQADMMEEELGGPRIRGSTMVFD